MFAVGKHSASLGEALARGGRTEAAAEWLRETARQGNDVSGDPRKEHRLLADDARLLLVQACLKRDVGNLPRAVETCQKARERVEQARREVSGDRSLSCDWLATREERARCRFLMGQLPREHWIDLALASTLPADARIPNPAGRAVRALRDYVTTGFYNPHRLRTDPALEPLRKREDFQKLVGDLEAKVQGRTAPR